MKCFLYFVLVVSSSVFSGERVLYDPSGNSGVSCYKHTIPELVLDCKLKSTKDYNDVKRDGFLVLKMRAVQSRFNKLIIHTKDVRNAIGSGKIKELLSCFFQGLPPTVRYRNDLSIKQRIAFQIGSTFLINLYINNKYQKHAGLLASTIGTTISTTIFFENLVALTSLFVTGTFDPLIRYAYAPYFYHQWKNEQNKRDVIEYNFEFVTDKDNKLLSRSFEDLIVKGWVDVNSSWYHHNIPSKREALYGNLVIDEKYSKVVQDDTWPMQVEITICKNVYYEPNKRAFYTLTLFSDDFEKTEKIEHRAQFPFDTVIDVCLSVTDLDNMMPWSKTDENRLKKELEDLRENYALRGKKILFNVRYANFNVDIAHEGHKQIVRFIESSLKRIYEGCMVDMLQGLRNFIGE